MWRRARVAAAPGFVGQRFRASFIAETSLTPPPLPPLLSSCQQQQMLLSLAAAANQRERMDGRTATTVGGRASVCCNICNDFGGRRGRRLLP